MCGQEQKTARQVRGLSNVTSAVARQRGVVGTASFNKSRSGDDEDYDVCDDDKVIGRVAR